MNSWKRVRGSRGWCVLVSAALVVVLAGCGGGSGTSTAPSGEVDTVLKMPDLKGQTIVINSLGGTFGDAVKKDLVVPFEKATGAKVVATTNCCDAFETQVKGGQFAGDIVLGQDYGPYQAWGKAGLLKSDPRLAQIAQARGVDADHYQDNIITTGFYAEVLAWNTKYANDHPTSWTEFFDTSKFKGTRGWYRGADYGLEATALGTGTPASSVYPVDVDKALATLTTLRKNASVHFWKDGADHVNQLGTGEIAYGSAYSNRVAKAIQQGLPLDMTFNQGLLEGFGAVIPATAKNVDGAVAFIDFYMSPSVQAAFANDSALSPAYPKAAEMVDPSIRKYMVTAPENLSQTVKVNDHWWLENATSADAAFTKWLTGS